MVDSIVQFNFYFFPFKAGYPREANATMKKASVVETWHVCVFKIEEASLCD